MRRMNSMFDGHHGRVVAHAGHVPVDGLADGRIVPRQRQVDLTARDLELGRRGQALLQVPDQVEHRGEIGDAWGRT